MVMLLRLVWSDSINRLKILKLLVLNMLSPLIMKESVQECHSIQLKNSRWRSLNLRQRTAIIVFTSKELLKKFGKWAHQFRIMVKSRERIQFGRNHSLMRIDSLERTEKECLVSLNITYQEMISRWIDSHSSFPTLNTSTSLLITTPSRD